MNTPIEAQSLSSLNHLFANPPQYPRNPTHEVLKPLVLYIVRVPGSQDVFLTPLKPPTKASVSLEAIQSSLYYLHVETPDDEYIRQSLEQDKQLHNPECAATVVRRKPLQQLKQGGYEFDKRSPRHSVASPSEVPPYLGTNTRKLTSAPARAHTVNLGHEQRVLRKPLGPRGLPSPQKRIDNLGSISDTKPDHAWKPSEYDSTPIIFTPGETNSSDGLPELPSAVPYQDAYDTGPNHHGSPVFDDKHSRPVLPSLVHDSYNSAYGAGVRSSSEQRHLTTMITLIRRDPASGAQWNIGSISPLNTDNYATSLKPIAIELDSPGYSKFMYQPEWPSNPRSNDNTITNIAAMDLHEQVDHIKDVINRFERKVEFRQQLPTTRPRGISRTGSGLDAIPNHPIPNKPQRSVFSFMSPWQGVCAFSNGIDGKSLKCRHSLSSTGLEEDTPTVSVAELRFNLPWSVLSSRDMNQSRVGTNDSLSRSEHAETLPISQLLKEPRGGKEAWRRSVQHLKNMSKEMSKELQSRDRNRENRPPYTSANSAATSNRIDFPSMSRSLSSDAAPPPLPPRPNQRVQQQQHDEEHRISLKLGREKAGGGFKGNSAKLGKLIIEDEGLKMGDLVVAACMGVWWQHYMGMVG